MAKYLLHEGKQIFRASTVLCKVPLASVTCVCLYRSRSRSPIRSSSGSVDAFEQSYGVSKETLLHGSYADYIKEYAAKSSSSRVSELFSGGVGISTCTFHKVISEHL